MATNKLNPKFCDKAQQGNHFDGDGMYLMVTPDGKKYWRMACYLNGKRKQLSFGSYPKISLAQAREERRKAQILLAQGIDPIQQKQSIKQQQVQAEQKLAKELGNTFEQIARRLYESKRGRVTEESRDKMLRQFEIHLFPEIGHKNMAEIEGKELLELFRKVAAKTNHGRPMTYMAKKLCQWSAEVYDFAHVEDASFAINPCRTIVKHLPKHDTQHMERIAFGALGSFIVALNGYGGHSLTKAAIWMMLYTGMRQASIRRAVWRDFDLEKAVWNRRPEKADKEAHALPLPKQAIALLQEIRSLTGQGADDLVFPSVRSAYHPMSEAAIGQAIERMGIPMVGHGLRGVVSTGLNELGFNPRIVEVQLGHKKGDAIEAAYNDAKHYKERKKMMQQWADYLDKLKAGADIIPFQAMA